MKLERSHLMRRPLAIPGKTLTALIVVLSGVWLALPMLLERIAPSLLADQGFGQSSLQVESLDWNGMTVRAVTIGTSTKVDTAILEWAPSRLRIASLHLDGLRLSGSWDDNGLSLAGLEPLLAPSEELRPSTDLPSLPIERLQATNVHLHLDTPQGPVEALADITAQISPNGIILNGSLTASGANLAAEGSFKLSAPSLRLTTLRGVANLTLTASDATVPNVIEGIAGDLALRVEATDKGVLVLAEGPLSLSAQRLSPAVLQSLPAESAAMLSGALQVSTDGDIRVVASPPAVNPATAPWSISVQGGGKIESGAAWLAGGLDATLSTTPNGIIHALDINGLGLEAQGIRAYGAEWSALLGLDALTGIPLDARADAIRLSVTAKGLDTGTVTARETTLMASGPMVWSGFSLRIALAEGSLAVATPATFGRLHLADDVLWRMVPSGDVAALEIAMAADGALTLLPNLALQSPRLAARLGPDDDAPSFDLTLGHADLDALMTIPASPADRAKATIRGGSLAAEGLIVDGIEGSIQIGGRETRLAIDGSVQTLPGEDAAPLESQTVRPFTVAANAASTAGSPYTFTFGLNRADGKLLASVSGQHDITSGRGSAFISTPEIAFSKDGLRPRDLYAPLAGAGTVTDGTLAAKGTVAWSGSVLKPDIQMLMSNLTLSHEVVELDGLNGVIQLTSLWPPATPAGQTASVRMIKAGLPLTDGLASFHLDGAGNLVLESVSLSLADGRLTTGPTTIPLDLSSGDITLTCTDLSLGALIGLTELEGLSAEGRLSGTIPASLKDGDILIRDGHLSTPEHGILRYRSDVGPDALGGGVGVELMLKALEDFHYRQLVLTVNGSAAGQIEVGIHLAGGSPQVYDNYPMEFNLAVSGELSKIISDSLSGYQIPDRIRQNMQTFMEQP